MTVRLSDKKTYSLSECQTFTQSESRIYKLSDCQTVRPSTCKTVRLSECPTVRLHNCQAVSVSFRLTWGGPPTSTKIDVASTNFKVLLPKSIPMLFIRSWKKCLYQSFLYGPSSILPLFSKHSEIVFPHRKLSTDGFLLFLFAHAQLNHFFLHYIFQPGQSQNFLKRRKFI